MIYKINQTKSNKMFNIYNIIKYLIFTIQDTTIEHKNNKRSK